MQTRCRRCGLPVALYELACDTCGIEAQIELAVLVAYLERCLELPARIAR